jgi:hypothetical protein
VELQKFANIYHKKELELRNPERMLIQVLDIDVLDAWSKLPPQLPDQYFVNCLGVFQHAGDYFALSELVEDGELSTTSQKSTYEYQSKAVEKYQKH